jgi:hypothetical protein
MNLLFIKTKGFEMPFYMEVAIAKAGIVFGADKVTIVSYNFRKTITRKNFEELTLKELIEEFSIIYKDSPGVATKETLHTLHKSLMILRNKKAKTQADVINLGKHETFFRNVKKDVKNAYDNITGQDIVTSLEGFHDEDILELVQYDPELEPVKETVPDMLIRHLITDDATLIFDQTIMVGQEGWLSLFDVIKPVSTRQSMMGSFVVFDFPVLDSLSYQQLRIIRNEFKEKMEGFHKNFEEAKKEFKDFLCIVENKDLIDERTDVYFNKMTDITYAAGNENLYFQQIKNSVQDVQLFCLHVGYLRIRRAVEYYKNFNMITAAEEAYINASIARHRNIDSLIFVFFIEWKNNSPFTPNKFGNSDEP